MISSENSSALNAPLPSSGTTSSGTASSPAISPDNGFDMENLFSPENILKAVYTKIVSRNKNTPGLDFVSSRAFIASLENEIAVIQRKTANNTFLFTSYHLNLVSKGPDKLPRKICIPTIRDRVVIALISAYLKEAFPKETRRPLANVVVNRVLKQRNSYQRFFKLDIKTFFASIDHELLFRKLRSRIHDETVLSLLLGIVNTKSFDPETRKTDDSRSQDHRGIPEGLSCSGLLADIFFGSFIGLNALIYMYVGYLNGKFNRLFYEEDVKLPMILISLSDILCNFVIYCLFFLMRGRFMLPWYFIHLMLPELIYTILVTILLYFIILKINKHLEKIEKRRAAKFV